MIIEGYLNVDCAGICVRIILFIVYLSESFLVSRQCVLCLRQDSHKPTQGWKVTFWWSVRGKFSVNNRTNDCVGNILQNKFYACCYILLWGTRPKRRCTPICGAAMLLRCNWCRNLAAVNYVRHKMRPLWGGITMCFWSSRYHSCMGSHYWIRDRSRRNYVWLTALINSPNINYFSTVNTIKYTHQWSI